jgi:hypothetical protein
MLVGKTRGFTIHIKTNVAEITSGHCNIRQPPAVKKSKTHPKTAIGKGVKTVHFINSRPLDLTIFCALCDEMGDNYSGTDGQAGSMVIARQCFDSCIHTALRIYLLFSTEYPFQLSSRLYATMWLQRVAYLPHIFTKINETKFIIHTYVGT